MSNPWPPPITSGSLVANRYRLCDSLGEGGFGEVFQAEDTKFDPPRSVALKLLHRAYVSDPQVRDNIKREASVLARFSHPHILRVLDFEVSREQAYIVTELATNGSLARLMKPDPALPGLALPIAQVAQYLEQVAGALDEAHDQGLIHRDIKPENILLDKSNRVLLADFGLALTVSTSRGSLNALGSGGAWGTAEYAAPEIWDEKVSKATDIYALGVLLYQMLTGYLPYQGTPAALMRQHLDAPVPRLAVRASWLQYPSALDGVIMQAMAKAPAARPRSAGELHRLFRQALTRPATVPSYTPTLRPVDPRGQAPYPAPTSNWQPPVRPNPAPSYNWQPTPPPPIGSSFRPNQMYPAQYNSTPQSMSSWEEGIRFYGLLKNLLFVLISLFSRPTTALGFYQQGIALAQLELGGFAIRSYTHAIRLDPTFAAAYRSRGIAYTLRGRRKAGRRDLEQAAQLGDTAARDELARL